MLNPRVIVEVLSPSTEAWDRGGKFDRYRRLPSLRQYVLVGQETPSVESFDRQPDDSWLLTDVAWPNGVLAMNAIPAAIPLREIYQNLFDPHPPA